MKKNLVSAKTVFLKKNYYTPKEEITYSLQDALDKHLKASSLSIRYTKLEDINFIGRDFEIVDFERVEFIDTDFRNASFKEVNFYNCTFIGTVFKCGKLNKTSFYECKFYDCVFENLATKNVYFQASSFNDVVFENIRTSKLDINRCSILSSSFINFSGFNFIISSSVLKECKLEKMYDKKIDEENKNFFRIMFSSVVDSSLDSVNIARLYKSYIVSSFLKNMDFLSPHFKQSLIRCETTLEDVIDGVYNLCKE